MEDSKMSVLKFIYRFKEILMGFLTDFDIDSKIYREDQRAKHSQD